MKVYKPGQKVFVGQKHDIEAWIAEVSIRPHDVVTYKILWWSGGDALREEWMPEAFFSVKEGEKTVIGFAKDV